MNNIEFNLVNGYKVKFVFKDDINIVKELCDKCSDYYILHDGVLPSMEDVGRIFTTLPPNKDYIDKFVLGIFKSDNRLVGIADLIRDFPTIGEWMLGLMLIDIEERGKGVGKIFHKALSEWAINLGSESFRIGVIEENYSGNKFWTALGYEKIKEIDRCFIEKTHKVNVMRLKLSI